MTISISWGTTDADFYYVRRNKMGNGKKEVVVGLKIKAKIDEALDNVKTLKDELNNFELSKGVSAEFAKEFKKIENQLDELQRKTASGEISLIDAKGAEKALDKIEKDWEYLVSKLSGQNLLGKNLKEDAAALKLLESLQTSYTKGIKEAESQQSKLSRQLEKAKQAEAELLETQKSQQVVSEEQLRNQRERAIMADREAREARKLRNEAEQALREKIASSNGKYTADDITKKGSNLRKTEAYRNFAAAQAAYDAADQTSKKESNKAAAMVTKDMQIAAAQEAKKAIEAADKALKDYQQTALETAKIDAFEKAKESMKKMAEFGDVDWEGLGINLDEIKTIDQLTAALEQLQIQASGKTAKAVGKIGKAAEQGGKGVREMSADVSVAKDSLEDLNKEAAQVAEFENRIKSFLGLAGAAEVLRRSVRDAMATIKELDATMTEMAVVTDLTVGDYWDQLPEYSQRASDLGVSINSAYKAATLYYQQGLKVNEVNAISAETLKMARIAGIDAADATDKMTAALRGFNMELNETSAQRVSDVYSELAAITAADTKEIANAMTKTASIASNAGMEFETTAAFLSQIIETTRESAETAGTAMKTVIARFQELKKDPLEIGGVDGEIVDANKIETALRSVGVALRDSSGQFRDLDDVFLELASKWESLDTNTQRYIATIAAGSRQQSRFIAMMSNYGRTQELVAAANNSAGASNRQFEKTMDSLEAKIAKLENAWHEFTMGIMNSDLVKAGVDILTKLLEIINKATSGFNGLAGSITKILSIVAVFKLGKTIFNKLREPMVKFFADIVREAGMTGERAGHAAREGLERSKQGGLEEDPSSGKPFALGWDRVKKLQDRKNTARDRLTELGSREDLEAKLRNSNKTMGLAKGRVTQATERLEQSNLLKNAAQNKLAQLRVAGVSEESEEWKKASSALDEANKGIKKHNADLIKQQKHLADIQAEQEQINSEINEYDENVKIVGASSQEEWQEIGQAIQKTGAAITGVGVATSALGGIFSSLGLDWLGEAFAKAGNAITLVGGAISTLGAIVPAVTSILSACGITLQASFWPILVIGLALVALVSTIALIVASFEGMKAASPAGQLEAAAKAADEAEKAANSAAEAFSNLNESLNSLDESYDALEDMRKGTEEWQSAVNELNNSVLDLITKYPELASLVKQEGGVLKLDVDSEAVQNVIQKYENQKALTAGASLGTKINVSKASQKVDFADLEAVKKVADLRGVASYATNGANERLLGRGEESFDWAKLGNHVMGNILLGNAIGGRVGGAITDRQRTFDDTDLQEAIQDLAKKVQAEGAMTEAQMVDFLKASGVIEAEAKVLAKQFAKDTQVLIDFASATTAAEQQQKAYYSAMASQAMSMVNLAQFTADEIDQMSSVVDDSIVEKYSNEMESKYADDDSKSTEKDLKAYIESLEGVQEVKKIKDNKVVYIDSEGKKQKVDKAIYLEQMKAAKATEKAAQAMSLVPGAIDAALKHISDGAKGSFEKVFADSEGRSLTQQDLSALKEELPSREKILDKNNPLFKAWEDLSKEEQEIWGDYETFADDVLDRVELGTEAFVDATENLKNSGISDENIKAGFGKMTAETAKAWSENLQMLYAGGGNTDALQSELNTLISGLSEEQTNQFMDEINAMDMSDINAWENLKQVIDELNIPIATNALQKFVDKGIEVAHAIEKIDFSTFNQELNKTYELIKKIQQTNSRVFDEDEFKSITNKNSALSTDFKQIGESFVYIGGSMSALTAALEDNTIANIDEANRQLDSLIAFGDIANSIEKNNLDHMNDNQLREYLIQAISSAAEQGLNLSDLGVVGLNNDTNLFAENIDKDKLMEWASAFAATGGVGQEANREQKEEGMREADILSYVYKNSASANAETAADYAMAGNSDFLKYSEALLVQAVESGGVSDDLITQYREAMEEGNQDEIKILGKQIADATEKIVENSAGRDAYKEMVDRVASAMKENRQKEIDKLSEINESINDVNQRLIDKIQEQIDYDRQQDALEDAKENLSDLYARQAYLGMDTSGANILEQKALDEEIKNAEKDLEQTMVDQAIQELADANEKASEQRERQIALMQDQLDWETHNGWTDEKAKEIVDASLAAMKTGTVLEGTAMYDTLAQAEAENLSSLAKQDWVSGLQTTTTLAQNWFSSQGVVDTDGGNKKPNGNSGGSGGSSGGNAGGNGQANTRNQALASAVNTISEGRITSQTAAAKNSDVQKALSEYVSAGGNEKDFWNSLANKYSLYGLEEGAIGATTKGYNDAKNKWFNLTLYGEGNDSKTNKKVETGDQASNQSELTALWDATSTPVMSDGGFNAVVTGSGSDSKLFIRKDGGTWYEVLNQGANLKSNAKNRPEDLINYAQTFRKGVSTPAFKTGGLASFTGPAWLDGTKSRPEYVLNAAQTERFFSLVDVLEKFNQNKVDTKTNGGDNHFDIKINVDKLESDYDVEQLAAKIRKMLYEDAAYRNVNAISLIR